MRIFGHSLGGMLARGLAVRRPDLVAGVITMGSPMLAPGTSHPVLLTAADVLVRTMRDDWRLKVDEPEAGRYPGYCKTRFLGRSTMDLPGLGFPRSQDNR